MILENSYLQLSKHTYDMANFHTELGLRYFIFLMARGYVSFGTKNDVFSRAFPFNIFYAGGVKRGALGPPS